MTATPRGVTRWTHAGRVFAELGVRDRAQTVVAAYESGLVDRSA